MTDTEYMKVALTLAKEAAERDEVPVGAVIVDRNGNIISSGSNKKEEKNCAVRHAEIEAIEKACSAINNWWLEDMAMYVTMEPCPMCAGAIINSRLKRLVYGAYDEKAGAAGTKINLFEKGLFNHNVEVSGGVLKDECAAILSEFFKKKRIKKQ
ncbi:MAG: nucleoside deaminase [Clostridiales bacterium]|nr:nucleoside deaminase [Clostridiales bacterium]